MKCDRHVFETAGLRDRVGCRSIELDAQHRSSRQFGVDRYRLYAGGAAIRDVDSLAVNCAERFERLAIDRLKRYPNFVAAIEWEMTGIADARTLNTTVIVAQPFDARRARRTRSGRAPAARARNRASERSRRSRGRERSPRRAVPICAPFNHIPCTTSDISAARTTLESIAMRDWGNAVKLGTHGPQQIRAATRTNGGLADAGRGRDYYKNTAFA